MMMPQQGRRHQFQRFSADRLNAHDTRPQPTVVAEGLRAAEARGRDDFLVVDPLAAMSAIAAMLDVAFAGNAAELEICWHDRPQGQPSAQFSRRKFGTPDQNHWL